MGHGKLRKFSENETFRCLVQPEGRDVLDTEASSSATNPSPGGLVLRDHPVKGRWNAEMFRSPAPIVLELGCGRGEYTIDLSLRNPSCNYIGVDIKGARLWRGAKYATQNDLPNVAFLRTRIEFIEAFFAPGEVSEIWLTFSDPQLKKENSRLTSPLFLERYRKFLRPGGIVHLKTDSMFLHQYSLAVARDNGLGVLASTTDLYGEDGAAMRDRAAGLLGQDRVDALYGVQTYYERMFLQKGLAITYLAFTIDHDGPFIHPTSFDAPYWKEKEGPKRTFSHQAPYVP